MNNLDKNKQEQFDIFVLFYYCYQINHSDK
jgi:hypothetical protein